MDTDTTPPPASSPLPLPGYLQVVSFGYFPNMAGHYIRRRITTSYLLIWIIDGRGVVRSEGQEHPAIPGDLIVLDHGPSQEYWADAHQPWSIMWVHYDGPASEAFFTQLRQSRVIQGRIAGPLGLDGRLQERFAEFVATGRSALPDHIMLQECLLPGLLGKIIHQLNEPAMTTPGPAGQSTRYDLTSLLEYIDEHLHEALTVPDLASQTSVSVRQFNRLFSQRMGLSPWRYILGQRVARASVLLSQTDLPVKQVGQAVGCDDPYYFSRLFKQMIGRSPRDYRGEKRG